MAASSPGVRKTPLEDRTFSDGGRVSIPVAGVVPPGRRLLGYELILDAVNTQPGAAAAAQLGSVLHQLVSKFSVGRRVSIGGLGLHFGNWITDGREHDFPAGYPATLGGVFSRRVSWFIPYSDRSAQGQRDGSVPSELSGADEIGVLFNRAASIFAATAPTITGTLRSYAVHDSARGGRVIPASRIIQDQDFSALQATIQKAGKLEYLWLYREAANDPGSVTDTQVSRVTVSVDGEPVILNARPQDLAEQFNRSKADGSAYRLESQTAPLSGESINCQPGFAAAAGLGVTTDFVPLIYPGFGWLISQAPEGASILVSLTGSITTYKLGYILREPRSAASSSSAARKLGAQAGDDVFAKTVSKDALDDGNLVRYLPQRLKRG